MSKEIPLKPENEQFTDSQWQAVFDGNQNILVSASAGSGKTTVLVRRVIEKLKAGVGIDRLLIVTYTEAAAKEMKERIQKALQEAITNESDALRKQFFIQQLTLLPTANISTLHAFCLTVIRRFYYLINMDPVFRLLTDETETLLLKEDIWDSLREKFYEENREIFYQLTNNFSNDRNDDGLMQLIFSMYDFAKANPDPMKWLQQLPELYKIEGKLGDSFLYQEYLKPQLLENLQRALNRYQTIQQLTESEEKLANIHLLASNEQQLFLEIYDCLKENQLEQAYEKLQLVQFDRYPTVRVEELKEVSVKAKELREENKKVLTRMTEQLFVLSPEKMKEMMAASLPVIEEMTRVETAFIEAFSTEKLQRGLVDFNDLEHLTLAILTNQESDQWQPSEASLYYREKFDEVLVDEYQDINRLQETILYWLRRPTTEEGNLFMVGDVKQSIYSFRLADPTLFIEKYNAYGKQEDGKRIVLAENFRSRNHVLSFTNFVFEQLMDEQVGQIIYDDAAKLINGYTQFPESEDFQTELLIYEKKMEEQVPALFGLEDEFSVEDKTEGELYVTALKIRELVDTKFPIYDKKLNKNRPIVYKDIVLLTPTKKNNLTILEIFKSTGIPIQVNDAQNYFQATEIRTMISLLQIIDNPYQDIPLASVLRSPIVGLTEKELVSIRLADKQNSFYEAFLAYRTLETAEEELLFKLNSFAESLAYWREFSRRNHLAALIWEIYKDTAYIDYVAGMPAGKQRQANLYALVDRATAYEKTSFRGLFQFIRFIEKMQEKDKDLAEPVTLMEENAVRVMTIHASKGLEFPVVFVLDLTKEFNLSDLNERYIFDDRLGAGIRYLEPEQRILYDTLPFLAIKQVKLKKLLSEEMRKLYVALTRAEQKLFLVGSYESQEAAWKQWRKGADTTEKVLSLENRSQGKSSLMNWIGMSLIRHQKAAQLQQDAVIESYPEITNYEVSFDVAFMNQQTIQEHFAQLSFVQEETAQPSSEKKTDQSWVKRAQERLNFEYPFETATLTTNYQSVSEIKRIFEDPDNQEIAKIEINEDLTIPKRTEMTHRMIQTEMKRPAFMETIVSPSSAEVGTATHYLLQQLDLTNQPTRDTIEELLQGMVEGGVIQEAIAKRMDIDKIVLFFETNLGQQLVQQSKRVYREQPFSMLIQAEALIQEYPTETKDELLIHGMIDGYIEQDDTCILFDYKTDFLNNPKSKAEIEQFIRKYQGQLNLYKRALTEATSKPVEATFLILLSAGIILDVDKKSVVEWLE